MIYGDNQNYPDCVKWFSVKLGREKKNKEKNLDIAAFLEEEEIKRLVNAAPTTQKKAFLGCLYESGARPEEFLRITNLDCKIDTNGAVLMQRGKTGERRVRIISFAKLLQEWLDINPLKNQNEFPIWISEATNHKNNPIGLGGAENIIKEALYKAGLENKDKRLYVLRHSRATHLCKHLTESQLCVFFGWNQGTKVVRRYIHLSGKDLDNTLLSIGHGKEIIQQKEYQLKTTKCNRCCEVLGPTQQFCSKCGLVCDLSEQYSLENKIQNENTELKKQILEIRNNNKIKDDVLTNLSDQLITLIGKVKELEQRKNLLCNPL